MGGDLWQHGEECHAVNVLIQPLSSPQPPQSGSRALSGAALAWILIRCRDFFLREKLTKLRMTALMSADEIGGREPILSLLLMAEPSHTFIYLCVCECVRVCVDGLLTCPGCIPPGRGLGGASQVNCKNLQHFYACGNTELVPSIQDTLLLHLCQK